MNESEINEYFPLIDDLPLVNDFPLVDDLPLFDDLSNLNLHLTERLYWYIDRNPDYSNFENNYIDFDDTIFDNTINNLKIFSIKKKITVIKENIEISNEEQDCCICMETRDKLDICSLNCNHKFCSICIKKCIKTQIIYNCSLCVQPVQTIKVQKVELMNINELD
jgi:hypothetical protein